MRIKQYVSTTRPDSVSSSLAAETNMRMESALKKLDGNLVSVPTDTPKHAETFLEKEYANLGKIVLTNMRK